DCGDDPGQPGTPTDQQHRSQRSEQPAGADDRRLRCPGGADQAQFPFEADVSRDGLGGYRLTCHVRTFFPGSHTEVQPPQLRLMLMIVKDHEKKACGFISVTWITVRAHVSALPGPYCGVATVSAGVPARLGRPAHALRAFRWPRRKDAGGRYGG